MQTNTNDKAKAEAYEISKAITMLQYVEAGVESNIQAGAEKILSFATSLKEPEEKWISVEDTNINWPDCEVLGYDGKTYMIGELGCDSKGNVYVRDEIQELTNTTHYKVLQPPKS